MRRFLFKIPTISALPTMLANQTMPLLDGCEPSDSVPQKLDADDGSSLSLSFREIAVAVRGRADGGDVQVHHGVITSPADDSFRFSCAAYDHCFADDVFLGGKLISLDARPLPPWKPLRQSKSLAGHCRPESGIEAEHRRLRRQASETSRKASPPEKLPPKWYLLVAGPMRAPAAMRMEEIRSRQRRPKAAENTDRWRRGSWRVIRSLTCNAAESTAVAPPALQLASHVRGLNLAR